jgi:hypothetical protein
MKQIAVSNPNGYKWPERIAQSEQHIPESKPKQQNSGLIFVNYQPPSIMTIEDLDKYIIYLMQIRRYAVTNNVMRIQLKRAGDNQ